MQSTITPPFACKAVAAKILQDGNSQKYLWLIVAVHYAPALLVYQVTHRHPWLPPGVAMSGGHVFTRSLMMRTANKSYVMTE
jgi:hypothetical protein